QLRTAGVLRRADAGDLRGRAVERERDLARHHVDFVAVGERDDDVRFLSSGRRENRRVGGVSSDGAYVEPVLQVPQDVLVDVDDGDFVRFLARQVEGRGPADLPCTQDQDSHIGSALTYCAMSHTPATAGSSGRNRPTATGLVT